MYARLNGLLLANDAMLSPPTPIQYFPLLIRLVRSLVKKLLCSTSDQLSIQCLLLDPQVPAIHRLQWLCPCSVIDAAVIWRRYQLLNWTGSLAEDAILFLTHMSTSGLWTRISQGYEPAIQKQSFFLP